MQGRDEGARSRGRAGLVSGWIALCAALGVALPGCTTNRTTVGAVPGAPAADATIAFESIDGPPPAVFQRLVQKLNAEAEARKVPVVSHAKSAPYRVRAYLALGVYQKKNQSVVSWVFDVYDTRQERAVRFSGEEVAMTPGVPSGRAGDPWQSVDDEVLTRVARAGMERLAGYFRPAPAMAAASPADSHAVPETAAAAIAARDDFRPEAHGIFRLFRNDPPAATASVPNSEVVAAPEDEEGSVPLPRHRPASPAPAREGRVASVAPLR